MDNPYCLRCGVPLRVGENWRPSVAVRKHYRCSKCISRDRRRYYLENQDHIKEQRKKYRKQSPELIMFTRIKGKAKREGIPFDLELSDIVIQGLCPVFGEPYVIGKPDRYNPSLDRINPLKGYVKGNVVVISKRANSIKNDATPEELRKVANFVDALLVSRYG